MVVGHGFDTDLIGQLISTNWRRHGVTAATPVGAGEILGMLNDIGCIAYVGAFDFFKTDVTKFGRIIEVRKAV